MSFLSRLGIRYFCNNSLKFTQNRLKLTYLQCINQHTFKVPNLGSNYTSCRTFIQIFKKPSQREIKIKDKIPEGFDLIYRNGMGKYITLAQLIVVFSVCGACVAIMFQPEYSSNIDAYNNWSDRTRHVENEEIVYMLAFVIIITVIQILVMRTPLRIYKVPKTPKYILITNGAVPFSTKRLMIERGNIKRLKESGILPWKADRYIIELPTEYRNVILIDYYFRRPADLNIMLEEQNDPETDD